MRLSLAVLVLLGVAVAGCSSDGDKKEDPKPRPQAIASADSSSEAAVSSETAAVSSETASAQPAGEQPAQPAGEQPAQPAGEQPAQPAGEQPAQPAGEQPAQPAGEQPAAETPKGPHDLPFNAYAHVSAGDWYCALARVHYEGKTPQGALPAASVWCWTGAAETDGDKAVLAFETKPAIPDFAGTRTWSKKDAVKGEDFFGGVKSEDFTAWTVEDDKKTVGDKEFACKKITCKIGAEEDTVWLSPDVPVTGIVAMTRKTDLGGGSVEVIEMEVGGFNASSPQATWGKSADDLAKDAK